VLGHAFLSRGFVFAAPALSIQSRGSVDVEYRPGGKTRQRRGGCAIRAMASQTVPM